MSELQNNCHLQQNIKKIFENEQFKFNLVFCMLSFRSQRSPNSRWHRSCQSCAKSRSDFFHPDFLYSVSKLASDVGFLWETFFFIILHMFSRGLGLGSNPAMVPRRRRCDRLASMSLQSFRNMDLRRAETQYSSKSSYDAAT